MLGWLKRKLKSWLFSNEKPWLDCVVHTKGRTEVIRYWVTGAHGLKLLGQADGSIRLIGEGDTADREKFWRLWRWHSRGRRLRWEDGARFRPGV